MADFMLCGICGHPVSPVTAICPSCEAHREEEARGSQGNVHRRIEIILGLYHQQEEVFIRVLQESVAQTKYKGIRGSSVGVLSLAQDIIRLVWSLKRPERRIDLEAFEQIIIDGLGQLYDEWRMLEYEAEKRSKACRETLRQGMIDRLAPALRRICRPLIAAQGEEVPIPEEYQDDYPVAPVHVPEGLSHVGEIIFFHLGELLRSKKLHDRQGEKSRFTLGFVFPRILATWESTSLLALVLEEIAPPSFIGLCQEGWLFWRVNPRAARDKAETTDFNTLKRQVQRHLREAFPWSVKYVKRSAKHMTPEQYVLDLLSDLVTRNGAEEPFFKGLSGTEALLSRSFITSIKDERPGTVVNIVRTMLRAEVRTRPDLAELKELVFPHAVPFRDILPHMVGPQEQSHKELQVRYQRLLDGLAQSLFPWLFQSALVELAKHTGTAALASAAVIEAMRHDLPPLPDDVLKQRRTPWDWRHGLVESGEELWQLDVNGARQVIETKLDDPQWSADGAYSVCLSLKEVAERPWSATGEPPYHAYFWMPEVLDLLARALDKGRALRRAAAHVVLNLAAEVAEDDLPASLEARLVTMAEQLLDDRADVMVRIMGAQAAERMQANPRVAPRFSALWSTIVPAIVAETFPDDPQNIRKAILASWSPAPHRPAEWLSLAQTLHPVLASEDEAQCLLAVVGLTHLADPSFTGTTLEALWQHALEPTVALLCVENPAVLWGTVSALAPVISSYQSPCRQYLISRLVQCQRINKFAAMFPCEIVEEALKDREALEQMLLLGALSPHADLALRFASGVLLAEVAHNPAFYGVGLNVARAMEHAVDPIVCEVGGWVRRRLERFPLVTSQAP